jgi:ketosteroid isomerase-like protein
MTEECPMSATGPAALVERMYECFNRGDLDTIKAEVFAADIVWNLPGRHPLAGPKHGPDEVVAFFAQLIKANIKVTLIRSGQLGDDAAVEEHRGYGEVQVTDGGGRTRTVVLDAVNCTRYTVRGGKIADVQVYMGNQHAADDFFNAVYRLKPIPDRLA